MNYENQKGFSILLVIFILLILTSVIVVVIMQQYTGWIDELNSRPTEVIKRNFPSKIFTTPVPTTAPAEEGQSPTPIPVAPSINKSVPQETQDKGPTSSPYPEDNSVPFVGG